MSRYFTHKRIAATIVFVTTCLASVWFFRPIQVLTNTSTQPVEERAIVVDEREEPQQLIDIFSDETLFYKGYDVRKLTEKVSYGHKNEVEVSYAVLQKYDLTLAKFDGVYFVEGNSTEFGLFPLLGNGSEQLIVSQTVPRGGRHWVVDASSGVRVLFDSWDYNAGREEFYVIDVDKDGIYEISLPFTAFYEMQDKMYIAEIPLPEIIFKFDVKALKYVRANHLFPDYTLRGIEQDMTQLRDNDHNYLSKRLGILLRYILADKWDEGWAFFNREYQRADKQEIKNRVVRILKKKL